MEASAKIRFLRVSPRKARLVADEVRGKTVGEALSLLQFSIKKGVSQDVLKVIKSAVANLQNKKTDTAVDAEKLKVAKIFVDDGPRLARFRARAQGRAASIIKRMCHITVTVSS